MKLGSFGMDLAALVGPLESRLACVKAAGFGRVTLHARDVAGHPGGPEVAVAAVRAAGLRVAGLQVLRDFEGLDGTLHDYKIDIAKAMLRMCRSLGCRLLLASSSTSAHAGTDPELLARDLRKLAMLALPYGIRIAYQALSWGRTVKDLPAASEVVSLADIPNLGLAVDSFHLFASVTPLDAFDLVDPSQIFLVQLSDFAGSFRVYPGEGVHSAELARLVRRLDLLGYRGDYNFDVFNDDYLQLPPAVVAERARRSALWLAEDVLQRSGVPLRSM